MIPLSTHASESISQAPVIISIITPVESLFTALPKSPRVSLGDNA
jgi:hypothetical protein